MAIACESKLGLHARRSKSGKKLLMALTSWEMDVAMRVLPDLAVGPFLELCSPLIPCDGSGGPCELVVLSLQLLLTSAPNVTGV
eukprot:5279131-Amphidinium_carterae.1